jgi:SpoVK/Ycf46/Vps4 family AAA+-type ATPase
MQILVDLLRRLARLLPLGGGPQTADPLSLFAQKTEPQAVRGPLVLTESQTLVIKEIVARTRAEGGTTIVLFNGSGSGKLQTAANAATDLQRDLYRVNLGQVVSEYIGETEKNLDRLLRAAERVNGVLFFDEADPLFGKRSEVKDSHDRYANIEISYLLQRLESYRGLAILATNNEGNFAGDRKRFHFVLDFARSECK